MIITDIRKNFRIKSLNEIYIDYEYAFSLYDSELKRFNIFVKREIEQAEIEKNIYPCLRKNATNDALRLVARMDTTTKHVRDKLLLKKYPDDVIEYVVDYMKDKGLLNDLEYAKSLTKALINKGKGRKYIEFELKKRGIDDDKLSTFIDENYREEIIADAYEKKLNSLLGNKNELDKKDYIKIINHLLRQGFSYEEISEEISRRRSL